MGFNWLYSKVDDCVAPGGCMSGGSADMGSVGQWSGVVLDGWLALPWYDSEKTVL